MADDRQPIIGVSHSWTDTSPCNLNQRHLADRVKQGVRDAGLDDGDDHQADGDDHQAGAR